MKRTLAVILVAILLAFMLPMAALGGEEEGIYEGEYDAGGKRSGHGTWAYHNFLYVGNWVNDMPNGEGILYSNMTVGNGDDRNLIKRVVKSNWVDGRANGELFYSVAMSDGQIHEWDSFRTVNGSPESAVDITITVREDGEEVGSYNMSVSTDWTYFVPLRGEYGIDSAIPAPKPTVEFDAELADQTDDLLAQLEKERSTNGTVHAESGEDDKIGLYEGERDAEGKRSGFGTWAYYNFLYVGIWENDLPNGEGTLYFVEEGVYYNTGTKFSIDHMLHGYWVDGLVEGPVYLTVFGLNIKENGEEFSVTFRINDVKGGRTVGEQFAIGINAREFYQTLDDDVIAGVPPWGYSMDAEVNPETGTPWYLYEKYPTGKLEPPIPHLENTGMGVSPGNLANRNKTAKLGDWVFIANEDYSKKDTVYTLYKMHNDGTQMVKLYESKNYLSPEFQLVDDWLYVDDPHKIRADDFDFTVEENGWIAGQIIDEWEYQIRSFNYPTQSVIRVKLDYSELAVLGNYENDTGISAPPIIYADRDWVYIYRSNRGNYVAPNPAIVSEIIKMKNDGSGEVEIHPIRRGVGGTHPQIVGGRIYYTEEYFVRSRGRGDETAVLSVDVEFSQAPVTLIPRNTDHHITALHVTDDYLYYGLVTTENGQGAIMRSDLDGGNPTLLADGFETGHLIGYGGSYSNGGFNYISIAGDWMVFQTSSGIYKAPPPATYLMRLDGTGLHKLGDPYIPEDAPGIVDSTGKWRYELLEDGTAMILGAGSKLKLTGKLDIPKAVDKITVTAISESAFYGYDGFTGVAIPKGVTTIGDYAFFFCKGLTSVTIPEGVTHIGDGAFQYCEHIRKVSLPASLASVGKLAFANCPSVQLAVAKKNEVFTVVDGVLFDKVRNVVVE